MNNDKTEVAEVSDEELEKISGGVDFNDFRVWKYCKYCRTYTYQIRDAAGKGWDQYGDEHLCHLFECCTCHNINYYDKETGKLI